MCHKEGEIIQFYTRNHNVDPNNFAQFEATRLLLSAIGRTVTQKKLISECQRLIGRKFKPEDVTLIKEAHNNRFAYVECKSIPNCAEAMKAFQTAGATIDGVAVDVRYDGS